MREYALVLAVSAAVTFLLMPLVRMVAVRWGAIAVPRDRDVHTVPVPKLGGIAMYGGLAAGVFVAYEMPTLHRTFTHSSEIIGILIGGAVICAVGTVDDRYDLDAWTKLAGDIVAAGIMVLLGVQLLLFYVPFGGINSLILGRDEAVPLTVLLCAVMISAINFIDGLDGLAAGVTGIAALAFFAYAYHLGKVGYGDVAYPPTLVCAIVVGICVGFLPYNFSPSTIIMGDSGARLLGLLLASISITSTTADAQSFSGFTGSFPLLIPLVVVLAVLAIPVVDLLFAVVRRAAAGRSPFAPDRKHLHHRLLELGHSQRRAVLLMYFWAALIAFGGVAVVLTRSVTLVLTLVGVFAVIGLILSGVPRISQLRRTPRRQSPR